VCDGDSHVADFVPRGLLRRGLDIVRTNDDGEHVGRQRQQSLNRASRWSLHAAGHCAFFHDRCGSAQQEHAVQQQRTPSA
jgi:hypothetical protein